MHRKGNFGRNKLGSSGLQRAYLVRKFVSVWRHLRELLRHLFIFPWDSVRFFGEVWRTGVDAAWRGGSRALVKVLGLAKCLLRNRAFID